MQELPPELPLRDILAAVAHIERKLEGISLNDFLGDMDRRRIVERCLEIISEASRRLPDDLKEHHPQLPWRKVAGIRNILRHDYEEIIPDALWRLASEDLPVLAAACRTELERLGGAAF
ncbi:MAG: HepT-like ribonuclease domain-containing protein [Rhizomicrobium sp.]